MQPKVERLTPLAAIGITRTRPRAGDLPMWFVPPEVRRKAWARSEPAHAEGSDRA